MTIKELIAKLIVSVILMAAFGTAVKAEIPDSVFVALYGDEQIKDSTGQEMFLARFYDGLKALHDMDMARAEQKFNECQAIRPTAAVHYELCRICMTSPVRREEAFSHIKKAVEIAPDNTEYRELLANFHIVMRDIPSAINIFEQLNREKPQSVYYLEQLISLYEKQENTKKIFLYLDKLEKINGYDESIADYRISIFTHEQNARKFQSELKRAIAEFPYNVKYRVLLADYYMRLADYYATHKREKKAIRTKSDAYAIYMAAHRIDPNNGFLLNALSMYYKPTDEHKADSLRLAAVFSSQLNSVDKLQFLRPIIADLYQKQDTCRIDSIFADLLKVYPEDYSIRKYFTEYLSQRGDSVRLLEQYGILHSQVPQDEDIAIKILMSKISSPEEYYKFAKHSYGLYDNDMWRYYYAVGIVNLKDSAMIQTAIDSLLPTLDSRHVASQLYMIYGEYFITKEADTIKGLSLYDLSLEKNPDNEYVLNNYAYFLYQMGGDMNRAEKMITHALEIKPLEATFLDTYACILFAKKDYFLAKFYMEKAIEQDGEDAVYYEHYGDILYHLNRPDEAIEQWKKAKGLGRNDALLDRKIETGQYCR